MAADPGNTSQQQSTDVTVISADENVAAAKKGVPAPLAEIVPGIAWLIEHGGQITGRIDPEGNVIVESHQP